MHETLRVRYILQEGINITVDGVPEEDFMAAGAVLPNPNGYISVGGHDKKKIQFIPVRAIIAVEGTYEQQISAV